MVRRRVRYPAPHLFREGFAGGLNDGDMEA